jgi:hypothetical protein
MAVITKQWAGMETKQAAKINRWLSAPPAVAFTKEKLAEIGKITKANAEKQADLVKIRDAISMRGMVLQALVMSAQIDLLTKAVENSPR